MDGVFMRKILCTCLILALLVGAVSLVIDRQRLREDLIRLHVVGASDADGDQAAEPHRERQKVRPAGRTEGKGAKGEEVRM